MELIPKAGYVLVEYIKEENHKDFGLLELSDLMVCGKILAGIKEQGMVVFFREYVPFYEDCSLILVKVDDIVAWIKPEVKEEVSEVVSA